MRQQEAMLRSLKTEVNLTTGIHLNSGVPLFLDIFYVANTDATEIAGISVKYVPSLARNRINIFFPIVTYLFQYYLDLSQLADNFHCIILNHSSVSRRMILAWPVYEKIIFIGSVNFPGFNS